MQPAETTSKKISENNSSRNIRDDIQSIKEDGAHIAELMIEQGRNKYDQMKSYSAQYVKALEKEVASKPVQSVAIAIGAGMILGFLLRRR